MDASYATEVTVEGIDASEAPTRTILIIDDEPGIANALSLTLRHANFHTAVLAGSAGLEEALHLRPFLVVLDLSLDGSDAVDVLRKLAAKGFDGAVQLISGRSAAMLDQVRRVGEQRKLTMLPGLRKPFRMRAIRSIAEDLRRAPHTDTHPQGPTQAPYSEERVDFAQALEQDWLEVWYQPKYRARDHEMIGAECLTRIRHPDRGLLLPGTFLPGLTDHDLQSLTDFVLRRACADWPAFVAAGYPLRLSVNVPCSILTDPRLVTFLRTLAPKDRAWPGLILELTEDQALRHVEAAFEASIQLNLCDVQLSIDDFGLGYSSLARLRDIPFAEIKLDRTLVDGCAGDRTKTALCRAIVDLAHTLGATVVAEGVENAADLADLEMIGCDTVQGYFFARPMTRDDLLAAIRQSREASAMPGVSGMSRNAG